MKEGLNFKQKCISTIVSVNDGRLDSLTLGQLYKIVDFLLTTNYSYDVPVSQDLLRSIHAGDVDYVSAIIGEIIVDEMVEVK